MAAIRKKKHLKKELSLLNVYAIAIGATLSSGFFLLPGIAALKAGPAIILSYFIAALHLVPAVFSMAELSTAMPRAGGIYYFLDRSLGPLFGTIGGLGTWFVLILKTAFALIGMGAYVSLLIPGIPMVPLAIALTIIFGAINLFGAKKTSGFQLVLVGILSAILVWFTGHGIFSLNTAHFTGFFDTGFDSIYETAGMVYISYVGITAIASVSEEVKEPQRTLPLGMILALITAIIIYALCTTIMVGVIPPELFYGHLTPAASAAGRLAGKWGELAMTVAAILAFFSVTNAAILSASRYPLAMSRDHLMPRVFGVLSRHGTPRNAIYMTGFLIIICLTLLNPTNLAKLASGFQLLLFSFCCLAVIIMRESHLEAYDPAFRSPFYPWTQLAGIIAPLFLIAKMGWYPMLFASGLIALGALVYFKYAQDKVVRDGAIYHVFSRLGEKRFDGLEWELRGILKERGLREKDPFDLILAHADILDLPPGAKFEDAVTMASEKLAPRVDGTPDFLSRRFLEGTKIGATPVSHGIALPHLRLANIPHPQLVILRSKAGIKIELNEAFLIHQQGDAIAHAMFFLVSSENDPAQHLRILAEIAARTEDESFIVKWKNAESAEKLKHLFYEEEHHLSLQLRMEADTRHFIGKALKELTLPDGILIATIYRGRELIFPRGFTVLEANDRITFIGEAKSIQELKKHYLGISEDHLL